MRSRREKEHEGAKGRKRRKEKGGEGKAGGGTKTGAGAGAGGGLKQAPKAGGVLHLGWEEDLVEGTRGLASADRQHYTIVSCFVLLRAPGCPVP